MKVIRVSANLVFPILVQMPEVVWAFVPGSGVCRHCGHAEWESVKDCFSSLHVFHILAMWLAAHTASASRPFESVHPAGSVGWGCAHVGLFGFGGLLLSLKGLTARSMLVERSVRAYRTSPTTFQGPDLAEGAAPVAAHVRLGRGLHPLKGHNRSSPE